MIPSLRQSSQTRFYRDAWLEIDLNAIEHNYRVLKALIPSNSALMAVVKSDAYGHGASQIAPVLEGLGCEYFGVASIDEGIQLREAGIKSEILILSPVPHWSFGQAIHHNLQLSLSNTQQVLELLKHIDRANPAKVQIKINTGMNRSGIHHEKGAKELIDKVLTEPALELMGVYTHLALAGDHPFSKVQLTRFERLLSKYRKDQIGMVHISASSALICPQFHFDLVRLGIMLYGLSEVPDARLKPVLSLKARISQIQFLEQGDIVGYNATWQANRPSVICILPLGYADGVKRSLSNQIQGILCGQFIPQVGIISMDQIAFDLTDLDLLPELGEVVTLIGQEAEKKISIKNWADILGTITYEIACDLRARLQRVYVRK
ncbi:MAG: alanine racemase [Candidatus Caenarcaniphilales bacterium]|nr:alanine racemase [Candidatus Caenarcaniphilales bacterium]